MGLAFALEQGQSEMIDWNRVMADALEKLASKPKKLKQTPSEEMQDELEPIEPNYKVGDFLDEVKDVEKMDELKNK